MRAETVTRHAIALVGLVVAVGCSVGVPGTGSNAQRDPSPSVAPAPSTAVGTKTSPIYDPQADARAEVEAALAQSRKDGRRVLLDFGADWCPDCIVLAHHFEQPDAKAVLERSFHVVRIDVGYFDRNLDVVRDYGDAIGQGIPAVVVLDSTGTVVASTADGRLANARTMTVTEVLALLEQWEG